MTHTTEADRTGQADLQSAALNGWPPIETAPKDGTRVRVGHILDPSSMADSKFGLTTGVFEDGKWLCNNAFVCLDMMLRWQPTHWLPSPPEQGK